MKRMWSKKELQNIVKSTKGYDFTNLVDASGHDRFVEGELTTSSITDVEFTYKKWSLSGTHLMLVLAFNADVGAQLTANKVLAEANLPSWIVEKIIPTFGIFVEVKSYNLVDGTWTYTTQSSVALAKYNDVISIRNISNRTIADAKQFTRIAFDLLIDND